MCKLFFLRVYKSKMLTIRQINFVTVKCVAKHHSDMLSKRFIPVPIDLFNFFGNNPIS